MKLAFRMSALFVGVFLSLSAMGGSGTGGTWGKTKLLLQNLGPENAALSVEGMSNIPESETSPKLVIPVDEYAAFVEKFEEQRSTQCDPFILDVEQKDGSFRYYELNHQGGEVGGPPLFLFLKEVSK